MQDTFNPYSPPEARVDPVAVPPTADVMWRDGKELAVVVDAPFPERCVKCNRTTRGQAKRRTFFWYAPWWNLLILINLIVCLIVVMVVRKRSRHEVSMCEEHAQRRILVIVGAWTGALIAPFLGAAIGGITGFVVFFLLFFTSIGLGLIYGRVITPTKIDGKYAWYRGVSPDFLARLPVAPPYAKRR